MNQVDAHPDEAPQIWLKQVSVKPAEKHGLWDMVWRIENLGQRPLRVLAVRLPHGQFKASEQRFDPAMVLDHGEGAQFATRVACDKKAGTIVENAFIILEACWLDNPWRIFVRLRVAAAANDRPSAVIELITTQRMGFATELSAQK